MRLQPRVKRLNGSDRSGKKTWSHWELGTGSYNSTEKDRASWACKKIFVTTVEERNCHEWVSEWVSGTLYFEVLHKTFKTIPKGTKAGKTPHLGKRFWSLFSYDYVLVICLIIYMYLLEYMYTSRAGSRVSHRTHQEDDGSFFNLLVNSVLSLLCCAEDFWCQMSWHWWTADDWGRKILAFTWQS